MEGVSIFFIVNILRKRRRIDFFRVFKSGVEGGVSGGCFYGFIRCEVKMLGECR